MEQTLNPQQHIFQIAKDALTDTQKHWGIENRLHWVRDVTFSEDFPLRQGGNAPVKWAILHNFFITLARFLGFRTIPQAQRAVFQSNPKGFFFLCMKPPCLTPLFKERTLNVLKEGRSDRL